VLCHRTTRCDHHRVQPHLRSHTVTNATPRDHRHSPGSLCTAPPELPRGDVVALLDADATGDTTFDVLGDVTRLAGTCGESGGVVVDGVARASSAACCFGVSDGE
jgi:hypothetical protein